MLPLSGGKGMNHIFDGRQQLKLLGQPVLFELILYLLVNQKSHIFLAELLRNLS